MATERRTEQGSDSSHAWSAATGQLARWVALDLNLAPPRTWFGPSWAVLGGVVSSGDVPLRARSVVMLAVAWLVSEPLLATLLALSVAIGASRRPGQAEAHLAPKWWMPYVQPGSPGWRVLERLAGGAARFARAWQDSAGACERWVALGLIAVALAAVGGGWVLPLVLLALLCLAAVAIARPLHTRWREALSAGQMFVAWLVGRSAFATPDYQAALVGLGYAAIWYAWTRRPPLAHLLAAAHILLAGLLAIVAAPLAAGGVLLLAVPLFVLQPDSPSSQRTYLPQTQPYLMASLVLAAWGLVWRF